MNLSTFHYQPFAAPTAQAQNDRKVADSSDDSEDSDDEQDEQEDQEKKKALVEEADGKRKDQEAMVMMQNAKMIHQQAQAEIRDAKNRISKVNQYYEKQDQEEAGEMEQYFKKSTIYDKYVQERKQEAAANIENQNVSQELASMKQKMTSLQSEYSDLQQKVHKQDLEAIKLQDLIKEE